jgi:hypothetical protein
VHDPLETGGGQPVADGQRLRAPKGAELKTVEVPIEKAARILHVGVPDQKDTSYGHVDVDAT